MSFSTSLRVAMLAALGLLLLPAQSEARDHGHGGSHGGGGGRYYHGYRGGYYGYGYPFFFPDFTFYSGDWNRYADTGYYGPRYGYNGAPYGYDEGAPGDLAVDVQRALKRKGYYSGAVDGEIGPGSRNAIRNFQSEHRIEVTGRIDRSTLRALGI